ncbi:MAG: hypothetical protein IKF93_10340 [Lachnospiraceae bacterium]|nr:hypothetical protein [Lachnospiraceae bacterium]
MKKLEIYNTKVINDYTTTAIASTVIAAEIAIDGVKEEVTAKEGQVLVLIVDNAQRDLIPGASYEVENEYKIVPVTIYRKGGPSAAPWIGAKEEEKASYYFRQGLFVDHGAIVEDASVKDILVGGSFDAKKADGITLKALGTHFNGILIDGGSDYSIKDSNFYAYGDGGDDLAGWGATIMADNKSKLSIEDSYIENTGAIRCALYVDNTSIANVKDTVIYTKETPDTYEQFQNLTPGMMKRVPFALGMEGTIRSLNVMADGQGKFKNCIVVSTGWGALSTDSGTAYDICGTYALEAEDTLGGIGTLEPAQEGKEYTAVKEVNGVKYGFTVGGSGYVTYADSGIHNLFKHVEFYSPDYIQVMGSGRSGSSYIDSYLLSGHTAFMTQQTGGGTFELTNTTLDTVDALIQMKSGAANTGFSNIIVDNCKINFSGASTRDADGILAELIESDDAGNPGITTYTINDTPEEAVLTKSSVADSSAVFKNGTYKGNIYNSIYNYRQALNVVFENASYTGMISSTTAVHVDLAGALVPNGTVLNAFMGSKEYDHCNYAADKGGMRDDAKMIGRFKHTASPMKNNLINVTLTNSKWNVTSDGYLNSLTIDALTDLAADHPVTICTKAFCVEGKAYESGNYHNGNVTVSVDTSEIEIPDNGVVDAGQTYGNVVYTLIAVKEDGSFDSEAVTVKRQNYVDGKLYFTLTPCEGYEISSLASEGGEITENTEGGELAIYEKVLAPFDGAKEMSITITVK